ncbi:interferon-induced protein with tetratricopeptide repeats 5-like [Leuresthes tenuis]|uniref:interferon-induced protein with tetratricopeptide repeats 5-like n=1 Tax=Leuresthes tenuis TaxID=355514 RepID=UPI003B500CA0
MSSHTDEDLHCRLQQLQSRFTWDLKKEDFELDDLSRQLQHDIDLQLGQPGAVAHSYSFLAYVRCLQDKPEEALSLLNQSEQKIKECYGEDSERRLIVTYGDLAWLKYHTGDHTQSQSYCQRVEDILLKHPADSSTVLHPEVYGEKAWTFLKFSKSYYPKAMECFCRALELQPDDCEFNSGYAIALYRTEPYVLKLCDEESPAIKQLRRALEISPDDGVLMSMLALKLLYYQKYREADGLVEKALEIGPDDTQILRYVAIYLRKKDQLDESIELLLKVLENNQSAFIHHQLALCYNRKKKNLYLERTQEKERELQHWRLLSIQHLEEAIGLKNTLTHAKTVLALQYAEENALERAQQLFDDVLEKLDEEFWSVQQVICRSYAEFCHYHTFQKDLAIAYYKKALEFSADTSEKRHCQKKLKQIAERRLGRNPRDAAAYGILGAVAKAAGDLRRAVEFYEKALEGGDEECLSALCELRLQLQ